MTHKTLAIEALNVWFLGYLIYHKPLKEKKDLYIQITYEAFNAVIGFIIVILNFLDISGDTTSQTRINCGWAIIGLNFAVLGFSVILGVISGISSIIKRIIWIKDYLKERKNRKAVAQSDQPTIRTHPVLVSRVNRMDAVRALQSTSHYIIRRQYSSPFELTKRTSKMKRQIFNSEMWTIFSILNQQLENLNRFIS